jgi:2-polyprenyl-3-methyl-5-hydroxy-6-metoxy-1,4-benzoquinol methylase
VANLDFLYAIRMHELGLVIDILHGYRSTAESTVVLEIGSGTGCQAKALAEKGYTIIPIDLSSSAYSQARVYPVIEYDGKNIPLRKSSVDVVFSSNVLEHVEHIDNFLIELSSVIKDSGFSIHVLPTASCRFWTMIAHYAWILKRMFQLTFRKNQNIESISKFANSKNIFRNLYASRHGERGNFITEIFYYTEKWWKNKFKDNGYTVESVIGVGIFYTMSNVFEGLISIGYRKNLSSIFGSSCKIYIIRKDKSI